MAIQHMHTDVGTSAETVAEANAGRKYLLLQNDGDGEVYLGLDQDAVVNAGILLGPGEFYELGTVYGNYAPVRVSAVAAADTQRVLVTEYSQ